MRDLMIDLETLGTGPDAVVVSIGAVFFDIDTKQLGGTFHAIFDVQEQLDNGRVITADTLKWWITQSPRARELFKKEGAPAKTVFTALQTFITSRGPGKKQLVVWGNGSSFDVSMIEHFMRMVKVEFPWGYSGINDLRTFKRFVAGGAKVENPGVAHDALDDAIAQANYVMKYSNQGIPDATQRPE